MYEKLVEIEINETDVELAVDIAILRENGITRRFVPKYNALNGIEMNYIGVLGEIIVQKYLNKSINLSYNYDGKADKGDLIYNNKTYDVKTSSIPSTFYKKIYNGTATVQDVYTYGLLTEHHIHHVRNKYDGVIFVDIELPYMNETKSDGYVIREELLRIESGIILGWVDKNQCLTRTPVWKQPGSKKEKQFYSKNVIFHYTEMNDIKYIGG